MSYLKLILIFIVFFNVSCSQTVQKNGISSVKMKEIKIEPGKTSRLYLTNKYGPPVFESIFNNNIIYYVSHVSSYQNSSDRETKDLVVLEIILNKKNIVQKVNKYDENNAIDIKISNRKTQDNNNKSLRFFKDLINNMSRRSLDN